MYLLLAFKKQPPSQESFLKAPIHPRQERPSRFCKFFKPPNQIPLFS